MRREGAAGRSQDDAGDCGGDAVAVVLVPVLLLQKVVQLVLRCRYC